MKAIHAVGCFDYVFFGLNRLKFTQSEHRRDNSHFASQLVSREFAYSIMHQSLKTIMHYQISILGYRCN